MPLVVWDSQTLAGSPSLSASGSGGGVIAAFHPHFQVPFLTKTYTHSTISRLLSLAFSLTLTHHKKIVDLCICAFSDFCVPAVVCLFFLTGGAVGDCAFLFGLYSFITSCTTTPMHQCRAPGVVGLCVAK